MIRAYRPEDAIALLDVFRSAVRISAAGDYSAEQIEAWAPARVTPGMREHWRARIAAIDPFVAELDGAIAGYADLQPSGYIDHFFVHAGFARRGVGSALMAHLLEAARARGLATLESDVSRTAQAFFARFGFESIREQRPLLRGVELANARMRLSLAAR